MDKQDKEREVRRIDHAIYILWVSKKQLLTPQTSAPSYFVMPTPELKEKLNCIHSQYTEDNSQLCYNPAILQITTQIWCNSFSHHFSVFISSWQKTQGGLSSDEDDHQTMVVTPALH